MTGSLFPSEECRRSGEMKGSVAIPDKGRFGGHRIKRPDGNERPLESKRDGALGAVEVKAPVAKDLDACATRRIDVTPERALNRERPALSAAPAARARILRKATRG
jgi:hypothetical protein